MAIEQERPNKPNFKLIGVLFMVAIIAIFVIAWAIIHGAGSHLVPQNKTPHPNSQLVLPVAPQGSLAGAAVRG